MHPAQQIVIARIAAERVERRPVLDEWQEPPRPEAVAGLERGEGAVQIAHRGPGHRLLFGVGVPDQPTLAARAIVPRLDDERGVARFALTPRRRERHDAMPGYGARR